MAVDLQQLALRVRGDVDAYVVREPHPGQLGTPLPVEWFEAGLMEMRAALVEPYVLELADHHSKPGEVLVRGVAVVADDGDQALLAFDPDPEGDFVLAWRDQSGAALSNIRGDAVGCFLSR